MRWSHLLPLTLAAALVVAGGGLLRPAFAADKLRVGKSIGPSFSYVPLDVGLSQGYFQKQGLDIEIFNFGGSARQMQALIADSVDLGLGSSTAMVQLIKGAPVTVVGVLVTSTANVGVVVAYDSPLKSIDDLKGKSIGITTAGSLTDWLVRELNRSKGWSGGDAAKAVAIGSSRSGNLAAIKVHLVDAVIDDVGLAFEFEPAKEARLMAPVSEFSRRFPREMAFVTNKLLKQNPDVIRRFLAAWYESIVFVKSHKAETIKIGSKVQAISEADDARMYDLAVSMYSDDGRFDPDGLAVLRSSFMDMGLLPSEPDLAKVYTETLLPAAAK